MTEPLLIDRFMPEYDVAIVYSRVYRVPPEVSFGAMVDMDLLRTPLIRALIGARGLPTRVVGAVHRRRSGVDPVTEPVAAPTFRIWDLSRIGWVRLGERPGRELVFGDVTKPWDPRGTRPDDPVAPGDFAAFLQPGFAKITESTRADPYGEGASVLTVESRVLSTDERSRRLFARYWAVVGPFSHLIRRSALRRLDRELG